MPSAIDIAVEAEELGYTDVWSAEIGAVDAFSPLAAVAARTERVRLGTALIPVFTRPPALAAMSAAAIQSLSGGRFVLGVGASSPAIVGGWMGMSYDHPVERVREYVQVLRDMLSGRKVDHPGPTMRVEGFRLQADPGHPTPIYVGALGPRMCRMAGGLADGVQLFLMTPDGVRRAVEDVRSGASEVDRNAEEIDVFLRLPVVLDEPEDVVRFMARRMLTGYAIVPAYNASLRRQGYAEEATQISNAWAAGDRDRATELFSDEMLEQMFLFGDVEACRARIDEFRAAGVVTPTLMPLSFAASAEERTERIRATVRMLAPGGTDSEQEALQISP